MREVYLDNAATMPVLAEALAEADQAYRQDYANPSSLHNKGYAVEKKITGSRERLAAILGASASEIFFTSGGTESNNLAVLGAARANRRSGGHILTTAIEHPSVLEAVRQLEKEGFAVEFLPVSREGRIDLTELAAKVRPETILVSVMAVNNETGVCQDIAAAAAAVKDRNPKTLFHSDWVQAFGKIKLPQPERMDLISLGGHKIGAPKGIGVLYVKKGTKLEPLFFGSRHQAGLRPGTENYPAVRAFEVAATLAAERLDENYRRTAALRQSFLQALTAAETDFVLNTPLAQSSPYIFNLGFPDIRAEVLLHALEEEGVYVSTGSACQSRKNRVSHVIAALGAPYPEGSIRISLGYQTEEADVLQAAGLISQKVRQLRRFVRK